MEPATNKPTFHSVDSSSSPNGSQLVQRSEKKGKFGNHECTTITLSPEFGTRLPREICSVRGDSTSNIQLAESPHQFHNMELPDLTEQRKIVSQLAREQNLLENIDDFSLENMAAALFYSGISSYGEMKQLGLKIIPPGPVFHTWYAYHGLTLFDGINNTRRLDYVKLIDEEASRLSEQGIPLLLIYTNNSMTESQIKTMNSLFADHDNVLVLSIEEDLSDLPMVEKFKFQETESISLMDCVRVCAIVYAKKVLIAAKCKAKETSKDLLLKRLSSWEDKSLTYNDIDNVLMRPRAFKIAENGFCNTSHLNPNSISIDDKLIEELTEPMKTRAKSHNAFFRYLRDYNSMNLENLEQNSERLFRYILSGSAQKEYQEIMNEPHKMMISWNFETNYYSSSTDLLAEEDIELIMSKRYTRQAFFEYLSTLSHAPEDSSKLSMLDGIQQLRINKMNYHNSWTRFYNPLSG
ncbi:hypothetical protein [Endozoicomonas sp. YOMI1]|uniref:hypothetical protein n=1 Tax=Endozoicomonas sp. YOMI1 TaxID=2828739 RepID=UPI002148A9FD|nr:hypothetical protein [Endozoicomonas sp. YOMI1]